MLTIIEFDFERKVERQVTLTAAKKAMEERRFVWIDSTRPTSSAGTSSTSSAS
jgi:hypothetical protein